MRLRLKLPGGQIETLIEEAAGERRGVALIAHPHPLHGGTLDNKVVWTLARAARASGLVAVRPHFRGVGQSEGVFDHGIGETEDLLALMAALSPHYAGLPWVLMGFSFGAYVQHRVAARWPVQRLLMVGPAVSLYTFAAPAVPAVLIHGSEDELIHVKQVRDYARQYGIPLHEVAGAGHFFHGRLGEVRHLAEAFCRQPWVTPEA